MHNRYAQRLIMSAYTYTHLTCASDKLISHQTIGVTRRLFCASPTTVLRQSSHGSPSCQFFIAEPLHFSCLCNENRIGIQPLLYESLTCCCGWSSNLVRLQRNTAYDWPESQGRILGDGRTLCPLARSCPFCSQLFPTSPPYSPRISPLNNDFLPHCWRKTQSGEATILDRESLKLSAF